MGMAISFIGGLVFLPAIDVSINMVSMFAFLVVLGIVVDDAIVVGENIHEYRERGMSPMQAAIAGTRDIARPVTFSILTTIVAFVPLLFMPGTTGKFWWPLPAVVITVLAVSLLEALFILPAHLGAPFQNALFRRSMALRIAGNNLLPAISIGLFDQHYRRFLDVCIRHRYVTIASAIALLMMVGGYGYSGHMGMIMMPEVSADEIEAGIRLPVGDHAGPGCAGCT